MRGSIRRRCGRAARRIVCGERRGTGGGGSRSTVCEDPGNLGINNLYEGFL